MNEIDAADRMHAAVSTIQTQSPSVEAITSQALQLRRKNRTTRSAQVSLIAVTLALVALLGGWGVEGPDQEPPASRQNLKKACTPTVTELTDDGAPAVGVVAGDCSVTSVVKGAYQPALSRDGRMVAFARRVVDGTVLMLRDQSDGTELRVAHSRDTLGDPDFSPDGRSLAFWLNDGSGHPFVYVVNLEHAEVPGREIEITSRPRRLTDGRVNELWPRWSPDGQRIAFLRGDRLAVFDLRTQTETVLPAAPIDLSHPFWSGSDAMALYAIRGTASSIERVEFRVVRLDLSTGEPQEETEPYADRFVDAAFDAGGYLHLATTKDGLTSVIATMNDAGEVVSRELAPGEPVVHVGG